MRSFKYNYLFLKDIMIIHPLLMRLSLAVTLYSAPMLVTAQDRSTELASRSNPADSTVHVPSAVYRSSFAGYHGFAEQKVADWRESNDKVGQIGGWRAYAREAKTPDPAQRPDAGTHSTDKPAPADAGEPHRHH